MTIQEVVDAAQIVKESLSVRRRRGPLDSGQKAAKELADFICDAFELRNEFRGFNGFVICKDGFFRELLKRASLHISTQ